ncbi:MAG: Gfo/Idh/MocA family oxidoreductase [Clostridiales bacterium]|nr:Gfo/Idh/MocA family oxidoreductase [Clostridiales bacterium]
MERIRVAVVGYGQIGPVHVNRYKKIPDKAEVVAVVDINQERLDLAKEQYGIERLLKDYRELLTMDDIDVIDVCIPTFEHHELVLKAAKHGKHVFCEKPMAMTMEDALEMEKVCKEAGVKLQLGFVRRFDNEWLKFKEIVTSGELGRPVVWRSASAGAGAPNPWFFQRELGGGPYMDGAVHNYDFGNFMFGKVKAVTAKGVSIQPDRTAVDTGIAHIEYESGDVLQMMWSWGLKAGSFGGSIHDVLGEDGALLFRAPRKDPLVKEDEDMGQLTISRPGNEEEVYTYPRNDMFGDELEHFIDCVINDEDPMVTGKHGQEALEVALAVLESFETEKKVYL